MGYCRVGVLWLSWLTESGRAGSCLVEPCTRILKKGTEQETMEDTARAQHHGWVAVVDGLVMGGGLAYRRAHRVPRGGASHRDSSLSGGFPNGDFRNNSK